MDWYKIFHQTLNFLIQQKTKIIILSHIGRPKGKVVKELSLKPICNDLEKKLSINVKLVTENITNIKNKNFHIIGSAHNFKEINLKKKQGCKYILLSRLFRVSYKPHMNFLGINKLLNKP